MLSQSDLTRPMKRTEHRTDKNSPQLVANVLLDAVAAERMATRGHANYHFWGKALHAYATYLRATMLSFFFGEQRHFAWCTGCSLSPLLKAIIGKITAILAARDVCATMLTYVPRWTKPVPLRQLHCIRVCIQQQYLNTLQQVLHNKWPGGWSSVSIFRHKAHPLVEYTHASNLRTDEGIHINILFAWFPYCYQPSYRNVSWETKNTAAVAWNCL